MRPCASGRAPAGVAPRGRARLARASRWRRRALPLALVAAIAALPACAAHAAAVGTSVVASSVAGPSTTFSEVSTGPDCGGRLVSGGGTRLAQSTPTVEHNGIRLYASAPSRDGVTVAVGGGDAGPTRWLSSGGSGGGVPSDAQTIGYGICLDAGPTATQVVVASAPGPAGTFETTTAIATCPPGSRLLSGGARTTPGTVGSLKPSGSFPSDDAGAPLPAGENPSSWTAVGLNGGGGDQGNATHAFAVCATGGALPDVVIAHAQVPGPAAASTATHTSVSCPADATLLGGGGYVSGAFGLPGSQGDHLTGSYPSDARGTPVASGAAASWTVASHSGGTESGSLTQTDAWALCGRSADGAPPATAAPPADRGAPVAAPVVGAVPPIADPLSAFARALGGHGVDAGRAVAVDGDGNTYVAGDTSSADFPVTPGGRPQRAGAATSAFVAKLDPAGRVVYTTLLGGRGFTAARAIAVDGAGRVYVTGATNATDYPTTRFALQRSYGGGPFDAFVTALDRSGHLAYSTFLGDTHYDEGNAIAVDRRGRAVVTGRTVSAHFPRARALRPPVGGGAFVTKLSRAGSSLVFSAVLGGDDKANRGDTGFGVAVDRAGATYVTGVTNAPAFPTVHALQPRLRGAGDAFVAKIDAAGRSVVYSTYLGGGGDDSARAVATDEAGNAYVAGVTTSHDLPTRHALQTANAGGADAFVTKLDPRGRALVYSTYLGASGDDSAYAIAVGDRGRAYVTGHTASSDLPAAAVGGGAGGAFVRRLSRSGASLTYSATIAGAGASGLGIAADRLGAIAVTGLTSDRGGDAFVTAVAPSTADFLRRQLVPRGASARILALLARGGARVRFALPAAGRVRVSWYAGRVLVARGRSSFAKAGTRTIDVRLDASGRLRLATRRAARLTAAVVFTAADRSPVSATAAFTLRR